MKYSDIVKFVSKYGQVSWLVGGQAYDSKWAARAAVQEWKRMAKGGAR